MSGWFEMSVKWRTSEIFFKAGSEPLLWVHNHGNDTEVILHACPVTHSSSRNIVSSSNAGCQTPDIGEASNGPDVFPVPFVWVRVYVDSTFYLAAFE